MAWAVHTQSQRADHGSVNVGGDVTGDIAAGNAKIDKRRYRFFLPPMFFGHAAKQAAAPDTSIPISGKEVEAQAAEIMALQVDHEATLQMLHEDLNRALKERADKDAALAEKLPADLGPGGQKMLEEAQAANQKQIKDDYAAEEANLRLQQGREMAGLQTKQVAEQNRDGR
jgi:hypothetical protein